MSSSISAYLGLAKIRFQKLFAWVIFNVDNWLKQILRNFKAKGHM